jgi:hypothetical protein
MRLYFRGLFDSKLTCVYTVGSSRGDDSSISRWNIWNVRGGTAGGLDIDQSTGENIAAIEYVLCEIWGENLFEGDWAKPTLLRSRQTLCPTAGQRERER